MKAGIINVTGYAGIELARLLSKHPEVELVSVTGRSAVGKRLPDVLPHLWSIDLPVTEKIQGSIDIVFSTLPSGASAEALAPLIKDGVKAVDIAADFRLHNSKVFESAYKVKHPAPELLEKAVYGLPELHREMIKSALLVANPGCYPEAAILALAPAVKAGLISDDIIVDAKSGISGAGRGGQTTNIIDQYAEANENLIAYGLDGHAHQPEIAQELAELRGSKTSKVTFVPHRVPMTRGILATCYAPLVDQVVNKAKVREIYKEFYRDEPFVLVTDTPPQTKHTTGTNMCLVYPSVDVQAGRLVVVSCLDNLMKGAAGQAIQNMNLMFGLPETMGTEHLPIYP